MAQITITINNREYAVACEDGQEGRILQLSNILDEKAKMFAGTQINENMLLAMIGLILADELTELKKGNLSANPASEEVNKQRLLEIDNSTAALVKSIKSDIKGVANKIDLL